MPRARVPRIETSGIARQLVSIPEFGRLRELTPSFAQATDEIIAAVLEQAAAFAADRLETLNAHGEHNPPRLEKDGVKTDALHRAVWKEFTEAGWISLDLPPEFGGQGLPLAVAVAVQEVFDRHCAAFGMLPIPIRSAVRLIDSYAEPALKSEWLPPLIAGEWGATICISEAGAGSDAARIKTQASRRADGGWSVTGEKLWTSFGDHDLTARIGHCLLAHTDGAKGLSLFLVPDRIDGAGNEVAVRSIEHKLGLHLSPTCAMGFEDSAAYLLGEEGRGLAQMFVMISNMRLAVGAMGLGLASGAADIALAYARERLQGGPGPQPIAIIEHADVQRQLLAMHAEIEMSRGLLYMTAVQVDLSRYESGAARDDAGALVQWLLPIVKTRGGDAAFNVASGAIQVLGGAGYTSDWPVEQALRDARVLTIFEGTTGIQALDLVHRRLWKDKSAGLRIFLAHARADVDRLGTGGFAAESSKADHVLDRLESTAEALCAMQSTPANAEAGACAFLDLATLAALSWTAARLISAPGDDPTSARLRSLAAFHLSGAAASADLLAAQALLGSQRLQAIQVLT